MIAPKKLFCKKTEVEDQNNEPWVEKYRPKNIDQVVSQEEVVSSLKKAIQDGNLPHLLFYGPPGSGKTSTILALARELFGSSLIKERVLELNASDERGIDVIRDKVKFFSQTTIADKKNIPSFKIVILDEADSMTSEAQAALRRMMEVYTKMTRFCLICNYVSRIIDPLSSRCAKFRFKPLERELLRCHLDKIGQNEKINYENDFLDTLISTSNGDLRKCINLLQICFRWKKNQPITSQDVHSVAGTIPIEVINNLVNSFKSKSHRKIEKSIEEIILNGYSASSLLSQIHDYYLMDESLDDSQRISIFYKMSEVDWALNDGADEELQLKNLGSTFYLAYSI